MVGRRRFWPLSASAQDRSKDNCLASFGHCQVDPGPGCERTRSELNMTNRNRITVELHPEGGFRINSDQDAEVFVIFPRIPENKVCRLDPKHPALSFGYRAVDRTLGITTVKRGLTVKRGPRLK